MARSLQIVVPEVRSRTRGRGPDPRNAAERGDTRGSPTVRERTTTQAVTKSAAFPAGTSESKQTITVSSWIRSSNSASATWQRHDT